MENTKGSEEFPTWELIVLLAPVGIIMLLTGMIGSCWAETMSPWLAYPLAFVASLVICLILLSGSWIGNETTTLVEVGVHASMVFILLAILAPVFPQARNVARTTTCLSNQRKIGTAFLQYAIDYDDTAPPLNHWSKVIVPYISVGTAKQKQQSNLFFCPAAPKLRYGYAINGSADLHAKLREAQYIPLLYDSVTGKENAWDSIPLASLPRTGRHQTHNEIGNNITFADGHAVWVKTLPRDKPALPALMARR